MLLLSFSLAFLLFHDMKSSRKLIFSCFEDSSIACSARFDMPVLILTQCQFRIVQRIPHNSQVGDYESTDVAHISSGELDNVFVDGSSQNKRKREEYSE